MGDVHWIKVKVNIFDDEKIKLIESMPDGDSILVIWFKILTQAGKCNADGLLQVTDGIPYTEDMLSVVFNRPLYLVKKALDIFFKFGLLEIQGCNVTYVTNWEKHQNIEGLELIREQARERVKRYRNRKIEDNLNNGNVTVTQRNDTESDTETDTDINKRDNRETVIKDNGSVENYPTYHLFCDVVLNKNREAGKIVMDDSLKVFKSYFCNYIPIELHNQEFIETWIEWVDYRKATKHQLQAQTAKKQLTKLSRWDNPVGVLEQSIFNGWTGLFELRENGNGKHQNGNRKKSFTGLEHGRIISTEIPDGFRTLELD